MHQIPKRSCSYSRDKRWQAGGGGLGRPETGKTCCLALALTLALAPAPGTGNSSLLGSFSLGGCANILIKFSPWQLSLHQSAAATQPQPKLQHSSCVLSLSLSLSLFLAPLTCVFCLSCCLAAASLLQAA